MIEFVVSLAIWIALALGGGQILRAGWSRIRCARMAFEAGHAELLGESPLRRTSVRVTHEGSRVVARASCPAPTGTTREEVAFEKLENMP